MCWGLAPQHHKFDDIGLDGLVYGLYSCLLAIILADIHIIWPNIRNDSINSRKYSRIRGFWKLKCGENRNHGKFKIYFLMVEL